MLQFGLEFMTRPTKAPTRPEILELGLQGRGFFFYLYSLF